MGLVGVFSGEGFLHTYPNGDQIDVFSVVFLCRAVGGVLGGRDDETMELRYVAPTELPDSELLRRYPSTLFSFSEHDATLFAWDKSWLTELD